MDRREGFRMGTVGWFLGSCLVMYSGPSLCWFKLLSGFLTNQPCHHSRLTLGLYTNSSRCPGAARSSPRSILIPLGLRCSAAAISSKIKGCDHVLGMLIFQQHSLWHEYVHRAWVSGYCVVNCCGLLTTYFQPLLPLGWCTMRFDAAMAGKDTSICKLTNRRLL